MRRYIVEVSAGRKDPGEELVGCLGLHARFSSNGVVLVVAIVFLTIITLAQGAETRFVANFVRTNVTAQGFRTELWVELSPQPSDSLLWLSVKQIAGERRSATGALLPLFEQWFSTIHMSLIYIEGVSSNSVFAISIENPPPHATVTDRVVLGTYATAYVQPESTSRFTTSPVMQFAPAGGKARVQIERLDWNWAESASVGYHTENGTATANRDYVPASGTLTFAPGERKEVQIDILPTAKLGSGFSVRLENANAVFEPGLVEIRIAPVVTLDSALYSVSDDNTLRVGVTLSEPAPEPFAVLLQISQDTEVNPFSRGLMPKFATNASFELRLQGYVPPAAAVTLFQITTTNFLIGRPDRATVLPNGSAPAGDLYPVRGASWFGHGETEGLIEVRPSWEHAVSGPVQFFTEDGTAKAGIDYVPTNGVLAERVAIRLLDDSLPEPPKSFWVNFVDETSGLTNRVELGLADDELLLTDQKFHSQRVPEMHVQPIEGPTGYTVGVFSFVLTNNHILLLDPESNSFRLLDEDGNLLEKRSLDWLARENLSIQKAAVTHDNTLLLAVTTLAEGFRPFQDPHMEEVSLEGTRIRTFPLEMPSGWITALAVLPDNRIAAGLYLPFVGAVLYVFHPDGSLDSSFGPVNYAVSAYIIRIEPLDNGDLRLATIAGRWGMCRAEGAVTVRQGRIIEGESLGCYLGQWTNPDGSVLRLRRENRSSAYPAILIRLNADGTLDENFVARSVAAYVGTQSSGGVIAVDSYGNLVRLLPSAASAPRLVLSIQPSNSQFLLTVVNPDAAPLTIESSFDLRDWTRILSTSAVELDVPITPDAVHRFFRLLPALPD